MSRLTIHGNRLEPADPLWKRAPARGDDGRPLSDFMMLIPGLSRRSEHRIQATLSAIHETLMRYENVVVFADFNLRLNLLWVSVKPVPGICLELPTALNHRVPEAKLIADKPRGRR